MILLCTMLLMYLPDSHPRQEEGAETDSTGFLTVEFDPDLAVRKQWGLY